MKILITGSTGLLGQALVKRLTRCASVVGLSRHPPTCLADKGGLTGRVEREGGPPKVGRDRWGDHVVCDLTDAQETERALRGIAAEVVIHTQAMSDVDRCEREPEQAERMNTRTVEHLCASLKERAIPVFILSTDYVFDGAKGRPYDEGDDPSPLSVYGRTKLAGEQAALRYPNTFVIRPSTLFGPGRHNFCDTIVQRAKQHEPIEAFSDQATSPTYTEDLADGIQALIEAMAKRPDQSWPRVYHMANAGGCRRVEFAHRVLELLGETASLVKPIRMAEQERPARRPPYSVLTSRHLEAVIGRVLRPWDDALQAYLINFASKNLSI